jgi:hypothetical protein
MMDANHKKIVFKICSQSSADAKVIYEALNYKNRAFKRKNMVLSEN